MIKEELPSLLLENVDKKESRLNKVMRNANQPNLAILIIKKQTFFKSGKEEWLRLCASRENY